MSCVALACALFALVQPLGAQSLLERTPNLSGGWTGTANQLHFHLVHRFNHSGPPARQVQNRPTFLLGYTLPWPVLAGAHYATRSGLVAGVPNEWEVFLRGGLLRAHAGAAADVAVQLGYNAAAESIDGELSVARGFGPARVIGALRAFSSDAWTGERSTAFALGALLRVRQHVALAGDAVRRFAEDDDDIVWGAALQLHLPTTPHTLSLHAANSDATTLHASSRAAGRTRWGFEFTVPITPRRYLRTGAPVTAAASSAAGDVVPVVIQNLRYDPDTLRIRVGTTVEWRNRDPLEHTATAVDGSWDSGPIPPEGAWRRRFDAPGRHELLCTPHPFMRAVVIVE